MFALHVTTANALDSILREGLQPRLGPNSTSIGEPSPGIWLFPAWGAMEGAEWLYESFPQDEQIALLMVDLDGLDIEHDDGIGYEVCVRCPIAPDRVTVLCGDLDAANALDLSRQEFRDASLRHAERRHVARP